MHDFFQCGRFRLSLTERPLVMGILNATPDSFSDGGQYRQLDVAIAHARSMIAEGADLIDIGGESTRPGAPPVSVKEELARLLPLVEALHEEGVPLSCDTRKPEVMQAALAAGADMINDINGFRDTAALTAVKEFDCGLCIMHMQNDPLTMQRQPDYTDVTPQVGAFLRQQKAVLLAHGIMAERICIDPGFGFGKTLTHNLTLLKNLGYLQDSVQAPVLAGLSRKAMIGALTGKPIDQRQAGSVAAALAAASHGARMLRVHDVGATVDALKIWHATGEVWKT